MLYRSVRFASAAALLIILAGCSLPVRKPASPPLDLHCANAYMKAMTHTDFDAMYACMGGDLRHRLEERADARNRTPAVQAGGDRAALNPAAPGGVARR